jgi:hypothetical protein
MRWHYISGALFGLFALTWVFSGLLSMEPFAWTNAEGLRLPPNVISSESLDPERFEFDATRINAALNGEEAFEIGFGSILGAPVLDVATNAGRDRRLLDAATFTPRTEPLAAQDLISVLEREDLGAAVADYMILDQYDGYYYARAGAAPLPVLRVRFDDPAGSWYYFDLMTGQAVLANHRLGRVERWLFNGLHSLDFGFWYDRRPLWDIGMILLMGGALATSAIGLCLGWKRLFNSMTTHKGKS